MSMYMTRRQRIFNLGIDVFQRFFARQGGASAIGHKWFEINASEKADEAEILIYDYIGWGGVTAQDFVSALKALAVSKITVSINTPGGDVFDGLAIANALRAHPAFVTTKVVGLAASIGSIIALAGDQVVMHENSFMMIHNPWGVVIGGASDMREMASILDKIGNQLAEIYQKKSGKNIKTIHEWMDAETWFTAKEAKEADLIDGVIETPSAEQDEKTKSNKFDMSAYRNVPKALTEKAVTDASETEEQMLREGMERTAKMRRRLQMVQRDGYSR